MRFNRLWLPLLLTLLPACSEKGKTIHRHEPAPVREERSPLETSPTTQPTTNTGKSLTELAGLVLDPKRVEDPSALVSRATQDDLIEFNSQLLALRDEEWAKPEMKELARQYKVALQLGCTTEYRDSCTGLRYFRRAANSAQVVKLLAKKSNDGRVRLLLMAIEIKNRQWDGELTELLLAAATGPLSTTEAADVKKAQSLLSQALSDSARRVTGKEEARRFLDSMQGWTLLTNSQLKLEDGARLALIELAARADYLRGADGRLHPGLARLIDETKKQAHSVFEKQKLLREQKLFIPAAVGAREIGQYDELLFLLDAVYTELLRPQEAATLITSLRRTNSQLREAVENYLRIQFLAALYEGTKVAAAVFSAPVESERLLRHALDETSVVTVTWQTLRARATPLRTFALLATQGGKEDQQRLRNTFDSIGRSINQIATYPHMMVLFHLLSKKRFEVYLPFIGRSLNTADLMRWLFEGRFQPLFHYSDEGSQLNHFQLIHSFDLAVRTSIFEASGIDIDDFMSDMLQRQIEVQDSMIRETVNRVKTRLVETTSMAHLQNICTELRGGPKAIRQVYFGDMTQSPYLGKMTWQVFESMTAKNTDTDHASTSNGALARYTLGLNYADSNYNEMLESVRLDYGTTYRMGTAMLKSYRDHLTRFKLPALGLSGEALTSEVARRTKNTQALLERWRKERSEILAFNNRLFTDLGSCYIKVANHDREVNDRLIEYEKAYLRDVHRTLVQARRPGLDDNARTALLNSLKFTGLPGNFQGRDRLSTNGFNATQVDLLIRFGRYFNQGLNAGGQFRPPLAPNVQVNYGERLDLDVPIVRETHEGFVPFVEDENEFVTSALKLYFRNRSPFVFFKSLISYPVTGMADLFKNMISGYRLSMELTGTPGVVDPRAMLKHFDLYINYVRITPEDREFLQLMHQRRRFDKIMFDRRWLRTDETFTAIQDIWAIYDFPLQLAAVPELGYSWDLAQYGEKSSNLVRRQSMFIAGVNYYESRSPIVRGSPVIPFNAVLDDYLDSEIAKFVKTEIKAVRGFQDSALQYLSELAQRPAAQRPVVDIDLDLQIRDLYNEGSISNYRSNELEFHQQTNGMFR